MWNYPFAIYVRLNANCKVGCQHTSLPLFTFQAYWPLCQPYELTNSFLGFPWPIYFFFTSYYSHRFITSFIGLPRPICFFFATYYFLWACWLLFLLFRPIGLYYFLFISPSYCWASSAIGPFVKSWHQQLVK